MSIRTHKEFLKELKLKNIEMYEELSFLEEYKGSNIKIKAIDKYGEILVSPVNLLRGWSPKIYSAINKTDYFKNMLLKKNKHYKNGDFYISSEFKNWNTIIYIEDKYGLIKSLPTNLISGQSYSFANVVNKNEYIENKLNDLYPNLLAEIEIIGEIKGYKGKVLVVDKYGTCNVELGSLLYGNKPSIKSALDKNLYFINQSKEVHGDKYDYSNIEYKNQRSKILIYCNDCKSNFTQIPSNHVHGHGCKNCVISKGEEKIRKFLKYNNIIFEREFRFNDCKNKIPLPFDFYLKDYSILIEYDGRQHFKPIDHFGGVKGFESVKRNDSIKTKYCFDNNIKLIRIPYWDYNNIESILVEYLN